MKPYHFFFTLILTPLFTACISEDDSLLEKPQFIITGNHKIAFQSAAGKQDRNLNPSGQLEAGSEISFFSKGGIEADNQTLTFNGSSWKGALSDTWIPGEKTAAVTAYYPTLSPNLYQSDGTLTDWLYQKEEFPQTSQLVLNFSHLFSQISFHLQKELNDQAQEICFSPSVSVSSINPYTAQVSFKSEAHTLCIKKREDATYTFIVPPAAAVSIPIEIKCKEDKVYSTQLPSSNFESGTHYNCNILYDDGQAGIRTAEDFIAFSHLINGEAYKDRSLKEFGVSSNGKMVYRLKNDIHFTEEESKQMQVIGSNRNEDKPFQDVFDGNNHELNGITLTTKSAFAGIFGSVGTSGEIRNLHIKNITYNFPDKTSNYDALLCGKNEGLIHNCHADSCFITKTNADQEVGTICGLNNGSIINCSTQRLDASRAYKVSCLAYASSGLIANCFVANCKYPRDKKTSHASCLCHILFGSGRLWNSYVYENISGKNRIYALAYDIQDKPSIQNCYYSKRMKSGDISKAEQMNIKTYTNDTAEQIPNSLNDWINSQGSQFYPEFQFTLWQKGEQIPAVFVTPLRNK